MHAWIPYKFSLINLFRITPQLSHMKEQASSGKFSWTIWWYATGNARGHALVKSGRWSINVAAGGRVKAAVNIPSIVKLMMCNEHKRTKSLRKIRAATADQYYLPDSEWNWSHQGRDLCIKQKRSKIKERNGEINKKKIKFCSPLQQKESLFLSEDGVNFSNGTCLKIWAAMKW